MDSAGRKSASGESMCRKSQQDDGVQGGSMAKRTNFKSLRRLTHQFVPEVRPLDV